MGKAVRLDKFLADAGAGTRSAFLRLSQLFAPSSPEL